MKCKMNGREVAMPCVISCELFGDCVAEYQRSLRERKPTNADCGRKPPMNNADETVRALLEECDDCSERTTDGKCKALYYCANRDAAALIESLQTYLSHMTAERDAAVAIVRCKDCKHLNHSVSGGIKVGQCDHGDFMSAGVTANHFCARGERRGVQQAGEVTK